MNKKLNWQISKNVQIENKTYNKKEEITVKTNLLMELMENFLSQADIQANSKKTYFKGLKNFIQWTFNDNLNNTEIHLSKDLLVKYKNHLTQSILKPHTQAVYLVSLKQFFVWSEANLIFPNIAKNIKGIKKITKQHHKDPLQKDDIIKLLNINKNTTNNIITLRNYTIINLLLFTGMRIGETTHIKLEDIEYVSESKAIIWIKGKGRSGKDNFIIILQESIQCIKEYLQLRKNLQEDLNLTSFLFVAHNNKKNINQKMHTDSISRIVKESMKKSNIKTKKISAHSLRHTYGVLAIKSGVSLHDLQLSMRHSTPTTTQVYLGDIEKEKRKSGKTEESIIDFLKKKEN